MTKYQGGYIGNTPGWANQNRSGVWNVTEQVSLKAKNQWPFEDGTIALRYILRNFDAAEGLSYDSGTITLQRDPDLIFWGVTGAGFSQAPGGAGGADTSDNNRHASPGESPRGAVYLSWRRPVIVQVSSINDTGGITAISTQQLGKGLKAVNNNTVKSFTSSSGGTGATFNLSRNASNLTVASLSSSGTGYSIGDILQWTETLGDGSGTTMDPNWDVILHGVAGGGGPSWYRPGVVSPNYAGGSATATGSPAAAAGAAGANYFGGGGGGGGAGWGGGAGGNGTGNDATRGTPGYSPLNTTYVTNGAPSSINYGSRAIELLVNGVQVKLIANASDSYSLANV